MQSEAEDFAPGAAILRIGRNSLWFWPIPEVLNDSKLMVEFGSDNVLSRKSCIHAVTEVDKLPALQLPRITHH